MPGISSTELSRRNAIRIGVGSAVASVAIGNTMAQQNAAPCRIAVDGAFEGDSGRYLVDVATGAVSKSTEAPAERGEMTRHFKLPIDHTLVDQSLNGDLLVRDDSGEVSRLIAFNSMRELQSVFNTVGQISEACFSPDGRKIGLIEFGESGTRLVVMNSDSTGRKVVNRVDQAGGMRSVSWSPCQEFVAVVAYDWDQFDESRGCPHPASHRVEMFSGTRRSIHLANSHWLDRVEWMTA